MSNLPPPPGGGSQEPTVEALGSVSDNSGNSDEVIVAQNQMQCAHVIVDGLLCSIIKANSRSASEHELVSAIE